MANWASYDIRITAIIDEIEVDVTQFSCDYELNAIPQASLLLPVGRNVRTQRPAAIHDLANRLKMRRPVTVFVEMVAKDGFGGGAVEVPEGQFKIFEGYTSGTSYEKFLGGLYFRVGVNHWLIDLSNSSTLSVNMHPANPGQFTFGALVTDETSGGASWSGLGAADKLTEGSIRTDLWAAIRDWLLSLAEINSLEGHALLNLQGKNARAIKALNRMAPGKAPPLAIDGLDDDLVSVIAQEIASIASSPAYVGSRSFWDLIVGQLSSSFLFAISPRVEDALVVPYVPGMREPFADLLGSHYERISTSAHCEQPLRAVCVLSGYESASGADGYRDKSANYLGGVYPSDLGDSTADENDDSGVIKIVNGPSWLARLLAPGTDARASSPVSGTVVKTSIARMAEAEPNPRREQLIEKASDRKQFLDRYAHARYALEMLQGRSGQLAGALRYDIAPGSTVFIEGSSAVGIPNDSLGVDQYATVMRVSYGFDAAAGRAATAFHLGYIRSAAENEDDKTSIDAHPLYAESWSGSPLVET